MGNIDEIKKALFDGKAVIGTKKILNNLKSGKLETIYLSLNCPESVKKDIQYYSKLNETKIIQLKVPNDELGVLCKKTFSISILGVAR